MGPPTALFLALALGPAAGQDSETHPASLSSCLRDRLDRRALHLPADAVDRQAWRYVEGLPSALLAPGELAPADEARRAAGAHERILDGRPPAPTPAAAQRVFDRLIAELPQHLKPDAFHYDLAVLDRPGRDAFTTGGGLVYASKGRVDDLLADADRGESALAFVLADEIAHTALGHTRRAWERMGAVNDLRGASLLPLPQCLLGALGAGAAPGHFAWTATQGDQADVFALHLCRNAGFDLDAALDSLRSDASDAVGENKEAVQTAEGAGALARLKHLLMERDGLFDDETTHGMFLYDRESGRLERCGPRQVGPGERPIVFVHGMRGNDYAFGAYLSYFSKQAKLAGRPLLVFRYPNNDSLSRGGQFLTREMRRVVAEPEKAVFVCHSAGGLVFRWYAEVRKDGFDRAILLATPHAGTRMAELKLFMDVGRFFLDVPDGLDYAFADEFGEGDGLIRLDLHPDSLFLRRLGREKAPAEKYQIFYGQLLGLDMKPWQEFAQQAELQVKFLAAKQYVNEAAVVFVPFPAWQARLTRWVDETPLPEEITRGDLAVSIRSASLPGVPKTTGLPLMHEAFRYDPDVMRRVMNAILEP
jgi:pimeloyl-ACP methyl ester carboxylesterase